MMQMTSAISEAMEMTSAISEAMEKKKRSLQDGLDAFLKKEGLFVPSPPSVVAGIARKGFRARKGERTEEEEKLPKHLRYR